MTSDLSKFDNVDLVQKLKTHSKISQATPEEQSGVLSRLSMLIECENEDSAWWWSKSKTKPFVLSYDKNDEQYTNGLKLVSEESILIIITDDFAPPWPVFSGSLPHILEAINDSNYTEYVIVSPSSEWAIFDNHHNALLYYGYIR